ncbi:hypothetical protein Dimus_012905 [Dionaea muscipula]
MAVAVEGRQDCGMEMVEREKIEIPDKATATDLASAAVMTRKDKRKALKKMKRKQMRMEMATREREEKEARLDDPGEQVRARELEQEEAERMERDRREFEERERRFLEGLELKKKREEEEEQQQRRILVETENQRSQCENENQNELNDDDDWEYVEEGPAEIIWQGNEIIVRKKKVRVPKKDGHGNKKEDTNGPISNPLAPQSEVFEDYKSAQELLESVAQQVPNFGTEQDKAHCPFHLKTGACRFGARCSRVHFYPDKSCTLLLKNMYSGPGLAWDQDEGLEYAISRFLRVSVFHSIPLKYSNNNPDSYNQYTDEEVERCFEDFYEDVHTEFLKFGEIVNFKVCNNGSSHLRGNVYVHYKSLESAVLAYHSINGRYFAGKQITCEFINVTRWKVAICGEYMKSRLKVCSRGSACNFIHCFRNPGGDYEWADWDKPPPRYWVKSMEALFGYINEYDKQIGVESPGHLRSPSGRIRSDADSPKSLEMRNRQMTGRYSLIKQLKCDLILQRLSPDLIGLISSNMAEMSLLLAGLDFFLIREVENMLQEDDIIVLYRTRRSRPREWVKDPDKSRDEYDDIGKRRHRKRERSGGRKKEYDQVCNQRIRSKVDDHDKSRRDRTDSDGESSGRENGGDHAHQRTSRQKKRAAETVKGYNSRDVESNSDMDGDTDRYVKDKSRQCELIKGHKDNIWDRVLNHRAKSSSSPTHGERERSTSHATRSPLHGDDDDDSDIRGMDMHRRHHRQGKKSLRKLSDGAEIPRSGSHGDIRDDVHGKSRSNRIRKSSTSWRESDFPENGYIEQRPLDDEDEEESKHKRRSSRKQSRESGYSGFNSHADMSLRDDKDRARSSSSRCRDRNRQHEKNKSSSSSVHEANEYDVTTSRADEIIQQEKSEDLEDERAYRLAALEKLEQKRRRLKNVLVAGKGERLGATAANDGDDLVVRYSRELTTSDFSSVGRA